MPVHELADMTWEAVRELDGARTVAILPAGAVEAHGPHLPLSTDVIIARGMAREGARRLAGRGYAAVLLPPLAYTPAGFAAGFPGTLSIGTETATALLVDLAAGLERSGIGTLAVANAHLDPAHLGSIRRAKEVVAGAAGAVEGAGERGDPAAARGARIRFVFPDVTRKPWALRLGHEFRSGACHAGRYETSLVMALEPRLVREEERRGLPAVPASLSEAIAAGKRTFEEAGGPRAYFGWPADARPEEGEAMVRVLGEILERAVLEALEAGEAREPGESGESGGTAEPRETGAAAGESGEAAGG